MCILAHLLKTKPRIGKNVSRPRSQSESVVAFKWTALQPVFKPQING